MTGSALKKLIVAGFVLGLLVGAVIYVPRVTGQHSIVNQHEPRFSGGSQETGLAPVGP
ncbi:MAG: hypothetical protein R2754_03195 [Microthrixaceae bacterium]